MRRLRSAGWRLFAFLRMRTISDVVPTVTKAGGARLAWARIWTSPSLELGLPNTPWTKKLTEEPFLGRVTLRVAAKGPAAELANWMSPPVAGPWRSRRT